LDKKMALLHLDQLSYGFPNKKLGTINLRVEEPEIIGLKGLNGSGKSTLLRTISGHLAPLQGSVFIQEKNIHALSPITAATLVSIIFTRRPQVFGITARELIEMGRFAHHQKKKDLAHDEALLTMISQELKLETLLPRMIDTLSDGEMQRVLIALALAQETPVILMDEPTAFLDYQAKDDFYFLLKKLKSDFQKLIIFSSHDLPLMERVADKMQNLED
jgi:iron complex transport system ATP-binding protein